MFLITVRYTMSCLLPTESTPVTQVQPWMIPVVVISACVLVLICVTIIAIGVVVGLKRSSSKYAMMLPHQLVIQGHYTLR